MYNTFLNIISREFGDVNPFPNNSFSIKFDSERYNRINKQTLGKNHTQLVEFILQI